MFFEIHKLPYFPLVYPSNLMGSIIFTIFKSKILNMKKDSHQTIFEGLEGLKYISPGGYTRGNSLS
jgi:hypothetical protein